MKSLLLRNGDLVLGPGGYETIDGAPKVVQDLGLAVREPFGSDRFHPRWGSILDQFIGGLISADTPVLLESEIRRIVQNYIALQQAQIQADATAGRPSRFTNNEVITGLEGMNLVQRQDSITVKVSLETMGRTKITIDQEVAA
jgi:hypothetical protein